MLEGVEGIKVQHEAEWVKSNYWMTNISLTEKAPITRDGLIKRLSEANIDSRPVFPCISQYAIWPTVQEPNPTAQKVSQNSINLPSGVWMKKAQVRYVVETILKAVGQ